MLLRTSVEAREDGARLFGPRHEVRNVLAVLDDDTARLLGGGKDLFEAGLAGARPAASIEPNLVGVVHG